jgi:hypothetical protein
MEEFLLQPLAQDGRPSSAASHASPVPTVAIPAQRNTCETLGKQGVIFVVFGSATIVATLGFFVFLWFTTESNSIWKRIMLADWGVRAVTITAVLSRWVAATQAALATAMIAGLILHRQQVALSDSAPLSLMRVGYSGPWSLSLLLSLTRNRSAKFSLYVDHIVTVHIDHTSFRFYNFFDSKRVTGHVLKLLLFEFVSFDDGRILSSGRSAE